MSPLVQTIRKITEFVQNDTTGDIQSIQKLLALASKEIGAAICLTDEKGQPIAGYTDTRRKFHMKKQLSSFENIGTLRLDQDMELDTERSAVIDVLICAILPLMRYAQFKKTDNEARDINMVKSSISALSYSELEAILQIFKELNSAEGVLVASKVAERANITRSVIVNALRKLESAGLVEARSLGVKGTYIKVINKFLLSELEKL